MAANPAVSAPVKPSLTLKRRLNAAPEKVFAAWTDPEILKQWWGPASVSCPEAHVDLREGGAYRLANLQDDGSVTWISGRFERVREPAAIAAWLATATRRKAMRLARSRGRERLTDDPELSDGTHDGPEASLIARERGAVLARAVHNAIDGRS